MFQGPIVYTGNKRRLMNQIKPLLAPSHTFVDMFAGSCTVGLNADAKRVIFNDKDSSVMELMYFLAYNPIEDTVDLVKETVKDYGLSISGQDLGGQRAQDWNKEGYLKLREDYNSNKSPLLFYLLILYSFNHQIRFNQSGMFNLPVGNGVWNNNAEEKLRAFHARAKDLKTGFWSKDFIDIPLADKPQDFLYYADPPYLGTVATYNEQGQWTETDEHALLGYLDFVHDREQKFALSNCLETKGEKNQILIDWLDRRNYYVEHLSMSYSNANYQRKNPNSITDEVLITNYNPHEENYA